MESRRDFLKKTSLFAGLATVANVIPPSLLKAMSIEAAAGSTYKDAEHVVFLMQENRSFDHAYGTLKGVRGFNDPRALKLPNGNPVWFQSSKAGKTFAPFRLDIKNTKSTWMGSLPHSWTDMVSARNEGKMDNWLEAKKPGKEYEGMPLTMGYYDRQDLPFYYAFADAFTVCDQNFCSSLTGTSSNRTFFWSGAIKEDPHDPKSLPHVFNGQIDYKNIGWKTFPERLEAAQIPWKVYQNELSLPVGLEGEEDDWLANFTDNSLEFFKQYNVRFHPAHLAWLQKQATNLPSEIQHLEAKSPKTAEEDKQLTAKKDAFVKVTEAMKTYNKKGFEALSDFEKNIHKKAFVTNLADSDYHKTEQIDYEDEGKKREMTVPKGDVLHQFRQDVNNGTLPMVSWLVAPCRFSDHPGSPWHGAWYISEVLDILTRNEEIWKKTIFILTYDESDGYFDHQSPFVPPNTQKPFTGKASSGIQTETEFAAIDQKNPEKGESPIGLGFRVPMVIASPWTKGGYVNSEIFDHTSSLQFLEHFIKVKTGKTVVETNISNWRRSVCGDLTSAFRPAEDQTVALKALDRNTFIESIYAAQYKPLPGNFKEILPANLKKAVESGKLNEIHPEQESGTKPSNAIPYQHEVNLVQNADGLLSMQFAAGNSLFGDKSAAGAFQVYARGKYKLKTETTTELVDMNQWNFCVLPDDAIDFQWHADDFENELYVLECYGANGFFRSFQDAKNFSRLNVKVSPELLNRKMASGNMSISLFSKADKTVVVTDNAYGNKTQNVVVKGEKPVDLTMPSSKNGGWYDFTVTVRGNATFAQRYAGRIETGKSSISDPVMGRV